MPPPLPTFKTCSYWALLVSITPALQLYLHHYLSWQKLHSKSNKGRSKRPSSKPSDVKIWLPTFPLYRVSLKIVLLRSDEIFLAVQQNLELRRFASNFEHFKGWQHSLDLFVPSVLKTASLLSILWMHWTCNVFIKYLITITANWGF